MEESKQSIDARILQWLSEHGYPFEMRIARSLAKSNFVVTQSYYFKDYESDKLREIDVVGRVYSHLEPRDRIAIAELETFITIECKSSQKPWVVFCETKQMHWNIRQAVCNIGGDRLLRKSRDSIAKTELHSRFLRAGHGCVQAFGGKDDIAYSALMSALKAAEAKANEYMEIEVRLAKEMPHVSESAVAIPVVAITAPLFECSLDDMGKPELRSVSHSSIAFRYSRNSDQSMAGTVVHIVTEEGWEGFENAVKEFHGELEKNLFFLIPFESMK